MNNDDKHFTIPDYRVFFVHFYFNPHDNLVGSQNYLDLKLRDLGSELAEGHRASEWESPFWIQALCL